MDSVYENLMAYAFGVVLKKRYTAEQIKKKLEKYLSEKIEVEGDFKTLLEKVVDRLKELAYIDDVQFCKDFINDRIRFKPRGRDMITYELRQKGVSKKIIDECIQVANLDELELGKKLLSKKIINWEKESAIKQKQKAIRFLLSKGFSRDSIYKLVENC